MSTLENAIKENPAAFVIGQPLVVFNEDECIFAMVKPEEIPERHIKMDIRFDGGDVDELGPQASVIFDLSAEIYDDFMADGVTDDDIDEIVNSGAIMLFEDYTIWGQDLSEDSEEIRDGVLAAWRDKSLSAFVLMPKPKSMLM